MNQMLHKTPQHHVTNYKSLIKIAFKHSKGLSTLVQSNLLSNPRISKIKNNNIVKPEINQALY